MPTATASKGPGALAMPSSPTRRTQSAAPARSPARTAAAASPTKATAGAKTAAEWNMDASELVRELEATQKEVADMLTGQAAAEQELTGMKEACSSELAQLQEETWRLQIFAELEKMKGLISQLRPIEDDAAPAGDAGPPAAAAAAASGSPAASPQPARPWSSCAAGGGGEPRDGGDACGGGSDCEGGDGVRERDEALATIDSELAVLMGAIRVAKDEVSGLLASKCDLQQQIADIYSAELEGEDRDEASN